MQAEPIDWEALYKQLVGENEALRLTNHSLRYGRNWLERLPIDEIGDWFADPAHVSIVLILLVFVVVPCIQGLFSLLRRRHEK